MRKVIGILLMGAVIGGFILSMKYRSWDEEAVRLSNDKAITAMAEEIGSSYPERPDEVVNCQSELMKIFYGTDIKEEAVTEYARTVRKLYSKEFLALNSLEQQVESLNKEKEEMGSSHLELVASKIMETYILKDEDGSESAAEVDVQHTTNEGSINRTYYLVKEDGLWKIRSWENQQETQDVNMN